MNRRALPELGSALLGFLLLMMALWLARDARSIVPASSRTVATESLKAPSDVVAVASYTLSASLDVDRHAIAGSGTITFANISEKPLSALFVHLYLNAFEHERTVFRRERSLGFRRRAIVHRRQRNGKRAAIAGLARHRHAAAMRLGTRDIDQLFRASEDELALVLPQTDAAGVAVVIGRLTEAERSATLFTPGLVPAPSVRTGIACYPDFAAASAQALLERAILAAR